MEEKAAAQRARETTTAAAAATTTTKGPPAIPPPPPPAPDDRPQARSRLPTDSRLAKGHGVSGSRKLMNVIFSAFKRDGSGRDDHMGLVKSRKKGSMSSRTVRALFLGIGASCFVRVVYGYSIAVYSAV